MPHPVFDPGPISLIMHTIGEFLQEAQNVLRRRHLSIHTEETYLQVIRRFITFHDKKHPATLGPDGVRQYLTYLAVERNVAASTQNVALNALVFLYRDVLKTELGDKGERDGPDDTRPALAGGLSGKAGSVVFMQARNGTACCARIPSPAIRARPRKPRGAPISPAR